MNRRVFFIGWVLAAGLSFQARSSAQEPADLLIVGGHYFDTGSLSFRKNPGLAVRDGRFSAVHVDPQKILAEKVVHLQEDHYILPGFIDLHAHYNVRLFKNRREEFEVMPVVYLANGATVTFSAGEYDPEGMDHLKKRIAEGTQIGPCLLTSGPYFGSVRRDWGRRGRSPEDIRADVEHWAARGVAGFKAKGIRGEELKALIDAAHQYGLTVTGHLGSGYRGSVNPRDAIEMGIDRIEHFLGGDALPADKTAYASLENARTEMPEIAEIIRLYVEKGIWFDATITAFGYFGQRGELFEHWEDERSFFTPYTQAAIQEKERKPVEQFEKIFHVKQAIIKAYFDAGGQITLGTDHFSEGDYLPGFGVHRELHAFVKSGIPPEQAIKIGTLNGARAMNIDEDFGSIEVGKFADTWIVQGNPIEDIRNTRKGIYVMREGRWYQPSALLDSVRGKLGPKDETEEPQW